MWIKLNEKAYREWTCPERLKIKDTPQALRLGSLGLAGYFTFAYLHVGLDPTIQCYEHIYLQSPKPNGLRPPHNLNYWKLVTLKGLQLFCR